MTDRPTPAHAARPDLRIVETRVYRGPNVWSYGPAIHLVVDLGSLEEFPTDLLPGFTDGLLAWLPGVGDAFTVAAGVMRVPLLTFVILVTIAKGARYAAILGAGHGLDIGSWF